MVSFLDSLKDMRDTDAFKGLDKDMKEKLGGAIDTLEKDWENLSAKFNEGIKPDEAGEMAQKFKAFFDELS